jgi:hypothetical protein
MIKLAVTDESALRADAADLCGTILNDLFHELARTEHVFLVHQICRNRGVDFQPSKQPLLDAA